MPSFIRVLSSFLLAFSLLCPMQLTSTAEAFLGFNKKRPADEQPLPYREQLAPFEAVARSTSQLIMTYDEWLAYHRDKAEPTESLDASDLMYGYELAIGDVLDFRTIGHNDLVLERFAINSSGQVSFPLVGAVQLTGKTIPEVEQELQKRLAKYVKSPNVQITLRYARHFTGSVLGAVKKPGLHKQLEAFLKDSYRSSNDSVFRLPSLLKEAGGMKADADAEHIVIYRPSRQLFLTLDLVDFLQHGPSGPMPVLLPNDVVYVPRQPVNRQNSPEMLKLFASAGINENKFPVRVYGYVYKPDVYTLPAEQLTLQSALAKAGLHPNSSRTILLGRALPNGEIVSMTVDVREQDVALLPNDVVMAFKEQKGRKIERYIREASQIMYSLVAGKTLFELGNQGGGNFGGGP